jgi:sortase A
MAIKSGIIFDSKKQTIPIAGEIVLSKVIGGVRFLGRILKMAGYVCIYLSIIGFLVLFFPIILSEVEYRLGLRKEEPKQTRFADLMTAEDIKEVPPEERRFKLLVPKIGLEAEVIANVDPLNKAQYSAELKRGLAHAKGSGFPGEGKTVYIFGHSTNYEWYVKELNALFYLLKELEVGDEVKVVFGAENFDYKVGEKRIVKANDLSVLEEEVGKERLVMQTCWPPGTTYKRLLVIAYPKEENSGQI